MTDLNILMTLLVQGLDIAIDVVIHNMKNVFSNLTFLECCRGDIVIKTETADSAGGKPYSKVLTEVLSLSFL